MRIFLSAGEPSGDLHGANLARELRRRRPDTDLVGLGGDKMRGAGVRLLYPLADSALHGIMPVLAALPMLWRVLNLSRECFRKEKPDGLVMIDYPGFHWWLAGCAKKHGIPVTYFVPPQIWAWATWRADKMRRLTDQVLACLPFEDVWFRDRGINSRFIGHPFFDDLAAQRLDAEFMAAQRARPGIPIGILPGSREGEITRNLPSLMKAAAMVHARRPDTRFVVACLKPAQAERVRGETRGVPFPIEVHHGRTPEVIELVHSVMAVSGSVSLEMLYRTKPATIAYRAGWLSVRIARLLMAAKYITLVNLLADRMLYPEYWGTRCFAPQLAGDVLRWLDDPAGYEGLRRELAALKSRVVEPGACERAAEAVLALAEGVKRAAA